MKRTINRKMILFVILVFVLLIFYFLLSLSHKNSQYVLKCDDLSYQVENQGQNLNIISNTMQDKSKIELNNGEYAVLLDKGGSGLKLDKGDTVKVNFANENGRKLQVGLVVDNTMYFVDSKISWNKNIVCEFDAKTKGEYAVYILNVDTDRAKIANIKI